MTTKELMIGDIIGVTHEELGLVYAKVESINETGDLMVRADNDYMDGGYECTVKECQPIEIEFVHMFPWLNPIVINKSIELNGVGLGLTVNKEDDTHIVLEHPHFGCIKIYNLYVHKLQHAIRMLEVDDKAKIVIR